MHRVLGPFAEHYNRRHRRSGHLWQGRYKALLVQDGDYFLEVSRYIHMNPDHNPETKPVETYPWSSYSNYTAGGGLVDWVETGRVLSYFQRPEDYKMFAESRRSEPLVSPFDKAVAGCLFGDDSFVKRIQEWLKGRAASPDVPARRVLDRWGCSPDIGLITDLVRSTFAGLSENRRNQLLGFVLWKYTWLKGGEIAEVIKRTPGAVSQIVRRIELKTTSDAALASALNTIKLRLEATPAVNRSSVVHPDDWLRRV